MASAGGRRRVHLTGIPVWCLCWFVFACDELGPDARGERKVTALQGIERDRQCVPLFDIGSIRWGRDATVELLLNDGSRWRNVPSASEMCPKPSNDATFAAPRQASELCSGNTLVVMSPMGRVWRIQGECRLQRFQRI